MMTDESLVERVARAMFDVTPFREEGPYEAQTETYRKMCRLLARAAIAAMRDSLVTEDFTFSEAMAIRRFLDSALKDEGVEG